MKIIAAVLSASLLLVACSGDKNDEVEAGDTIAETSTADGAEQSLETAPTNDRYASQGDSAASLDVLAEKFVKLSLAIGQHDPAFVDAYHGPAEWAEAAAQEKRPIEQLETDAQGLLISVARANADTGSARSEMLEKLVRAALTRIQMAQGETFSFDDETQLLYDVVAPAYDLESFDEALSEIDALLPGEAPLHERVDSFRNSLAVPADKLTAVMEAATAECRARTISHYALPDNEKFSLEFVTDEPWSGYNWYQGDYNSLIQINTDFPVKIDRAVDLGCHEGYPGHHTWNIFIERDFLIGKGWVEYSVYPLFSPLSLIAEGSANFGVDLAFPGDEKIAFERDVLFPMAGLDPSKADTLSQLNELQSQLSHARNHIAREFLDGRITRDEAVELSMRYSLVSRERADQSVRFIEKYRGYVLNYNIGRDLVADFIEETTSDDVSAWDAFATLLSTPLAASDITVR